jgi:hypothetical protein
MKQPSKYKQLQEMAIYFSQGSLRLSFEVSEENNHLLSKSVQNYLELPIEAQLMVKMSHSITGILKPKRGQHDGFVFQMSHGTQQIKKYEPEKYRNERSTPLRLRARTIVKLAKADPVPNERARIRELYRTYPFFLLKEEPINLRMKNFYFQHCDENIETIKIYRASNPGNLSPETDTLYTEQSYYAKKSVSFQYEGREEEYYYAINTGTDEMSNLLNFVWRDSLAELSPTAQKGKEW